MPATITDHEDYIESVWRAIPDAQDYWAWTDPKVAAEEDLADEIEISDASLALSWYLDTIDPGPAGIVTLPDGHALGWHETGGWTVIGHAGLVSVPGVLAVDASPAQVARVAATV